MKKIFAFCIALMAAIAMFAQMPKAINYQAVARNAQGQAIANQNIKVRLSIINAAANNAILYSETRNVTTNALGLFNVQIGAAGATATMGDFSEINWVENISSKESLKVEIDLNNTGTFIDMGSQALATVPYAFAAESAKNALSLQGNPVAEGAPNPGDVMVWDGWKWDIVSGRTLHPVIYPVSIPAGSAVAGSNLLFQWVGYQTIEVEQGQKLTASISATIGTSTGIATSPGITLAYQLVDINGNGIGGITPFSPTNYPWIAELSKQNLYAASGSITGLAPGKYRVGFAIRNTSAVAINNNGPLVGFIMVSN